MTRCFFVSDIHGLTERYEKLFKYILDEKPSAVFMGGDLLPSGIFLRYQTGDAPEDFVNDYLAEKFYAIRTKMQDSYPEIFLILGNDDPRSEEEEIIKAAKKGIWHYIHKRSVIFQEYTVIGYAHVPPTPFLMKDWEKYDVSRYVDPGCISPEQGKRTVAVNERTIRYATIKEDLEKLTVNTDFEKAVFLFHTPPHKTLLDRAALDGKMIDYVPLDVHVGSIAVRRFIETNQPLLTLHGHIHESSELTGEWKDKIGRTLMFNGAYHEPQLSLIDFDLENPGDAQRRII